MMKNSKNIYLPSAAEEVANLYGSLLSNKFEFKQIKTHLELLSDRLFDAWLDKEQGVLHEISNYHPDFVSCNQDELFNSNFKRADAQLTIAKEYGYQDWKDLLDRGSIPYNREFEQAVDLLLDGRLHELSDLMDKYPELVLQSSDYGHNASILHYCASNGVELYRQKVPLNLPEIVQLLIRKGADAHAKMQVYNGMYDTLTLLKSSAHPFRAGVAKKTISYLAQ